VECPPFRQMCSFIAANFLIQNLTYVNFFLQPRGPDATRHWHGYGFDFVHNLLHMTGERVLQPFHDPSERIVAFFNGEIYNWRELAEPGVLFRTDGDVLISAYLRTGVRFAQRLDGEFAVAVFDFSRGMVVLATDPFGTKPLWLYRSADGRFAVSSYRSALNRLGAIPSEVSRLEPNAIVAFKIGPLSGVAGSDGQGRLGWHSWPVTQLSTYEFDLRQHKNHTGDWRAAFYAAVRKRTAGSNSVALCLSDGYDSGVISLTLGELRIPHTLYTVQAREDLCVVGQRLIHLHERDVNAELTFARLSISDFAQERSWLAGHVERIPYAMRGGDYANIDDKASAGLSWIYRTASKHGQRLFLSGSGADETISDYGMDGQALEFHSTLRGVFPEALDEVFPWLNFFGGTQRDYLGKEEAAAGAHGIESRYPFLDRTVVQEYLWLVASVKNKVYKSPLWELISDVGYPFVPNTKRGFSADKNLAGNEGEVVGGGVDVRSPQLIAKVVREGYCPNDATLVVDVSRGRSTLVRAAATEEEHPGKCVVQVSSQHFLKAACGLPLGGVDVDAAPLHAGWASPQISRSGNGHGSCRKKNGNCSRLQPKSCKKLRIRRVCRGPRGLWRGCVAPRVVVAQPHLSATSRSWLAELSSLRPFREAAEAETHGETVPPLSIAVANGHVPNHRAAFLTSCMEEPFFWTYCMPLLSSFAAAFGLGMASATHPDADRAHRVIVATAGVGTSSLNWAEATYSFAQFLEFPGDDQALSTSDDPTAAENYRRISYQPLKLSQYVRIWQEYLLGQPYDFVVCMDSDMLVVRPFEHVFELLMQRRVDVAFTYYDGKREVPWGTATELARTKRYGYVRLQGGMLLMQNRVQALQWFAQWMSLTQSMLHESYDDGPRGERWRDLHEEFKGPSQAALAFLLTRGDVSQMRDIKACCCVVRKVNLELTHSDSGPVQVRMLGLPARYLNDAESSMDGRLPRSVHVAHLKGHWWRTVLPDAHEHISAPTRTYEWNREVFELWRHHYVAFASVDQKL